MARIGPLVDTPVQAIQEITDELETRGGEFVHWVTDSGFRIALILAITWVAIYAIRRFVPVIITRGLRRHRAMETDIEAQKRVETLVSVFQHTAIMVVAAITILMILPELGLNIAPLLAGIGIGGLALGLGAQSLVRDVVNGTFILLEDQYAKGDVIQVGGVSGIVESVNLRRTILRDLDGNVHTIPNGAISVVTNMTDDWSRVNLDVSVAYSTDIDHARDVINRVGQELAEDPEYAPLITEAPQFLRVERFAESSIDIKVLGVTKPIHQWTVAGELRRRLKQAFDREGIEIPLPHRVLISGDGRPQPPGGATPRRRRTRTEE